MKHNDEHVNYTRYMLLYKLMLIFLLRNYSFNNITALENTLENEKVLHIQQKIENKIKRFLVLLTYIKATVVF